MVDLLLNIVRKFNIKSPLEAHYLKDSYNTSFSKTKYSSVVQITNVNAMNPALESGEDSNMTLPLCKTRDLPEKCLASPCLH